MVETSYYTYMEAAIPVLQICVDWQKAFLTRRTQRVKLADTTSDWTEMAGGVPQGTLSGPENFLNMIDDLHTDVDDVKFVDDVTLYEVCNTHSQNKLSNAVNDVQVWATDNNMSLNASKTKELINGLLWKRGAWHLTYHNQWWCDWTCILRKATWMPHHVQPVAGRPHRQSCVQRKPAAPPTERTEESQPLY